jgi:hypothetical protein
MTRWPATAACAAVRAWTWLYTLPLDAAAQRARGDEIDSDLWDSPVVGWRGLSPGASSGRVVLRGRGEYVLDSGAVALRAPSATFGADDVTVRLLVQHEGRWAVAGEFPLRARVVDP